MKPSQNTKLISQHIKATCRLPVFSDHRDIYADIFGGQGIGNLMSKLVYWSDKGARSDGYFWKSMPELAAEVRMHERTIYRYRDHLRALGVVDTFVEMINGSPTNHWKVNIGRVKDLISEYAGRISTKVKSIVRKVIKPTPTPITVTPPPQPLSSFDQFWSIYPKKFSEGKASRAWTKLDPSPDQVDQILQDVRTKSTSDQWQGDGGRYIPNPASYLRDRRWEDSITVRPASSGRRISYERTYTPDQISSLYAPIRPSTD